MSRLDQRESVEWRGIEQGEEELIVYMRVCVCVCVCVCMHVCACACVCVSKLEKIPIREKVYSGGGLNKEKRNLLEGR